MRRSVLEQHAEGTAQLAEAVGDHRIADLGETRIDLKPGLVAEAAVGARREQDRALAEEVVVAFREGRELRRADEREVARVEEQDDPTAAVTRELEHDRRGLSADVRLHAVIGNGLADSERHCYHLNPALGEVPIGMADQGLPLVDVQLVQERDRVIERLEQILVVLDHLALHVHAEPLLVDVKLIPLE